MGRYEFYKSRTSMALTWLIDTAEIYGSKVHATAEALSTITPTARLKGKARKEAKAKAAQSTPSRSQDPESSMKYKVSTKEIIRNAEYLGSLDTTIVMPKRIWRAFKDAIKGRKKCAEEYEKKEADPVDNAGHVHFIDVLTRVIGVLSQCVKVQNCTESPEMRDLDDGASIPSAFAALHLDDDQDHSSDALDDSDFEVDDTSAATSTQETQRRYTRFEPEVNLTEEADFRWWCSIEDANETCNYISVKWEEYGRGDLPLTLTVILTEVALERLKLMEDDLQQLLAQLPEPFSIRLPVHMAKWIITAFSAGSIENVKDYGRRFDYPCDLYPIDKRMNEFKTCSPKILEHDRFFVQYMMELKLEESARIQYEKAYHDDIQGISSTSLDCISRFLLPLIQGKPRCMLPVAAGTLLYEIWASSEPSCIRARDELQIVFDELADEYECMLERELISKRGVYAIDRLAGVLSWIEHWPGQIHRYKSLRSLSTIPHHPYHGIHREIWKDLDLSLDQKAALVKSVKCVPDLCGKKEDRDEYEKQCIAPNRDADFLRKSNPAVCGKLVLDARIWAFAFGFDFANSRAHLFFMCILYNLLRQTGYLQLSWPALEDVITLHKQAILCGEPTTDLDTITNRIALASGIPLSIVTARSRSGLPSWMTTGSMARTSEELTRRVGKGLTLDLCPTLDILINYFDEKDSSARMLHRLDNRLQETLKIQSSAAKTRSTTKPKYSKSQPSNNLRQSCMESLGTIPFLGALETQLRLDLHQLDIDYFQLTLICSKLLRLTDGCSKALRGQFPTSEAEWDASAAPTFTFIFEDALAQLSDLKHRSHKQKKTAPPPEQCTTFTMMARILERYIREGAEGMPKFSQDDALEMVKDIKTPRRRTEADLLI